MAKKSPADLIKLEFDHEDTAEALFNWFKKEGFDHFTQSKFGKNVIKAGVCSGYLAADHHAEEGDSFHAFTIE